MTATAVNPFRDNWAYLKIELQWLERLLMVAVARRRQEDKAMNPLAKSPADRATSHWWKGVISITPAPAYDDRVVPDAEKSLKPAPTLNYQQQLDRRIIASQAQGILLGIPFLRDRLDLNPFEKNILLLAIAPEVNRRYARLYRFLEGEGVESGSDLPTVDLALRLLCHNDEEWREGRSRLAGASPLLTHGILAPLQPTAATTLLSQRLKLEPTWVNPLLINQPQAEALTDLLAQTTPAETSLAQVQWTRPLLPWGNLLLPPPLLTELQALGRARVAASAEMSLGDPAQNPAPGAVVVLVGPAGTGKTAAAQAIAHQATSPLWAVDLATIPAAQQARLWQHPELRTAAIVLLSSAQCWLGRAAAQGWDLAQVQAWLQHRRRPGHLTLLTVTGFEAIRPTWRSQVDQIIAFPLPDAALRYRLWQQSLPLSVRVDPRIDWHHLAAQLAIGGGEIHTIAQQAIALAQVTQTPVQRQQLQAALQQRGHRCSIRLTSNHGE